MCTQGPCLSVSLSLSLSHFQTSEKSIPLDFAPTLTFNLQCGTTIYTRALKNRGKSHLAPSLHSFPHTRNSIPCRVDRYLNLIVFAPQFQQRTQNSILYHANRLVRRSIRQLVYWSVARISKLQTGFASLPLPNCPRLSVWYFVISILQMFNFLFRNHNYQTDNNNLVRLLLLITMEILTLCISWGLLLPPVIIVTRGVLFTVPSPQIAGLRIHDTPIPFLRREKEAE